MTHTNDQKAAEEEFEAWLDEEWPLWRKHAGDTHYLARRRTWFASREAAYKRCAAESVEKLDYFRDILLNQRGALAENGMTNDHVNDVLREFDNLFYLSPAPVWTGEPPREPLKEPS